MDHSDNALYIAVIIFPVCKCSRERNCMREKRDGRRWRRVTERNVTKCSPWQHGTISEKAFQLSVKRWKEGVNTKRLWDEDSNKMTVTTGPFQFPFKRAPQHQAPTSLVVNYRFSNLWLHPVVMSQRLAVYLYITTDLSHAESTHFYIYLICVLVFYLWFLVKITVFHKRSWSSIV